MRIVSYQPSMRRRGPREGKPRRCVHLATPWYLAIPWYLARPWHLARPWYLTCGNRSHTHCTPMDVVFEHCHTPCKASVIRGHPREGSRGREEDEGGREGRGSEGGRGRK